MGFNVHITDLTDEVEDPTLTPFTRDAQDENAAPETSNHESDMSHDRRAPIRT